MVSQHKSFLNIMENCMWIVFVVTICHAADINYMNTTIQEHFSNIRHHETNPTYKEMARTFIYQEFQRSGLDTEFHNFTTTLNVTGSNIIGILKGKRFGTFKDRIAGIGAHYDTVRNSAGVDDNGSGVAAMLEVAKRAKTLDRLNTVIFVSFDLEEDRLTGSEFFVEQWLPQFLVSNYRADPLRYADQMKLHGFYILDTIMEYNTSKQSQTFPLILTPEMLRTLFTNVYNDMAADDFQGDFINSIYRKEDESLDKALSQAWQSLPDPLYQMESLQIPISNLTLIIAQGFGDFLRSDHTKFWRKSLPAVFITDSGNYRGDMINCYHKPCDNLDVMLTDDNLKFLGKQADALYYSLHYLAETETAGSDAIKGYLCFFIVLVTKLAFV